MSDSLQAPFRRFILPRIMESSANMPGFLHLPYRKLGPLISTHQSIFNKQLGIE
jgi:hypothetical protein